MADTYHIVQLSNDKDASKKYYPITVGNAVYFNNVSVIDPLSGKIPSQFLPSYVDDILEGLYSNATCMWIAENGLEEPTKIAARIDAKTGVWTTLEGDPIEEFQQNTYYYDANKSQEKDACVYLTPLIESGTLEPETLSDDRTWNYRKTDEGFEDDITSEYNTTLIAGKIDTLKGNTIVWNQLVLDNNKSGSNSTTDTRDASSSAIQMYQSSGISQGFGSGSVGRHITVCSPTNSNTLYIRLNGESTNPVIYAYSAPIVSHKYFISIDILTSDVTTVGGMTWDNVQYIDLTKLFGTDAEICSALGVSNLTDASNLQLAATNFERLFPNDYYNYNEGELISLFDNSKSFNVWDEDWVNGYFYINETGYHQATSGTTIRSNKLIPVSPNTTYYFLRDGSGSYYNIAYFENDESSFISATGNTSGSGTFVTPNNCHYIKFFQEGVSSYNDNICINISNPEYNGIYLPYGEPLPAGVKSTGFNLFDKNASGIKLGKCLRVSDGVELDVTGLFITDYIRVLPSTNYYLNSGFGIGSGSWGTCYYDINKNFISGSANDDVGIKETPANAAYMRTSGTVSDIDISCINISDTNKNGTYEPYKKDTVDLSWINQVSLDWNIWDEVWEIGYLNTTTGQNEPLSTTIRSKNYIPVFPSTTYYCRIEGGSSAVYLMCYDANKNVIATPNIGGINTSVNATAVQNHTFTVPSNCYYVRFYITSGYGTTYNHDITINLSVPAFDGRYLPYGERMRVFENGLCSAGTVYDEVQKNKVIKRVQSQKITGSTSDTITLLGCDTSAASYVCNLGNIGTLSSGVLTLSEAVTDAIVQYELATPFEYDLPTTHDLSYQTNENGTEQQLPLNPPSNVAPITAPFRGTFNYEAVPTMRLTDSEAIQQGCAYTPETGKIYLDISTNYQYRWSGIQYVKMISGNFATAARFGSTTDPNKYYGLGDDTVLDLPGISLNGGNLWADTTLNIDWWAPVSSGDSGNLLKSNGSNAPSWIANPETSRILIGNNTGASWDTTSLPTTRGKILLLTPTGIAWTTEAPDTGKILASTATGFEWTDIGSIGGSEVSTTSHGFAPQIPTQSWATLVPDDVILGNTPGSSTTSSWKKVISASSNWPSATLTETTGLMTSSQATNLQKLLWMILPFNVAATRDGSDIVLKSASSYTYHNTLTATKKDITVTGGIPTITDTGVSGTTYVLGTLAGGGTGSSASPNVLTKLSQITNSQITYTIASALNSSTEYGAMQTVTLGWKADYCPVSAAAIDTELTGSTTIKLVHQTVWGYIKGDIEKNAFTTYVNDFLSNNTSVVSEAVISGTYLGNNAFDSKNFTAFASEPAITYGKAWFAYPSEYGTVTDIKDVNGFSYLDDFELITLQSGYPTLSTGGFSTSYNVYLKKSAASVPAGFEYYIS